MICFFDDPLAGTMADIAGRIGGKGASLWAMTHDMGLPVPPGFTIGTEHSAGRLTDALFAAVLAALERIGGQVGRRYGDVRNPLLVSVRSGAAVSMPGMMDTFLNVGLTGTTAPGLGSPEFVAATRATLVEQMTRALPTLDPAALDDAPEQLRAAIAAVFASWDAPRARGYRARQGLADTAGTAVTIQAMVFGHRDRYSGTGVAFSRDPSTGAPGAVGDWLTMAQGEAVVGGSQATQPLDALATLAPAAHAELIDALGQLEHHYRDMVDVEFTLEAGKLWILQARPGKRTTAAATRIACDLVADRTIALSRAEAVARVAGRPADDGARAQLTSNPAVVRGLGVSPGLVSGEAALDCDDAIARADAGRSVILVRPQTSPEDVHGMGVAAGILTATGGMMSHAALVAREWGIAAVCSAPIAIDATGFVAGVVRIASGDVISIDGSTGEVFVGAIESAGVIDPYAATLAAWATNQIEETVHGQA